MFTRNSIVLSNNIKTPLTAISRAIGNILQLTYGQLVKQLFSNQEQGFAYDPNDLSTLYQDAAGTIPVTAAGQPVGLVLDKSKGLGLGGELNTGAWNLAGGWTITNGIATHAVGALGSCNLGGAVLGKWYKYRARVVNRAGSFLIACNSNIVININTPSDKIYDIYATSSVGGNGRLIDFYAQSDFDGDVYVSEVSVKEIRGNHAYQTVSASRPVLTNRVNLFNDSEVFSAWIRNDGVALSTPNPKYPNAVKLTRGASSVFIHRTAMTTIGTYTLTGLFKNVVGTVNAILANTTAVPMTKVGVTADGLDVYQSTQTIASVPNSSVTGIVLYNANDSVEVYGLDVRVTQQNSTLPPYQKVVGSTQFDTVGFPNYLLFDGADDFLQTNNIDFTATDKVSLFAGVRKYVNSARILCELSSDMNVNPNSFYITAPENGTGAYGFKSRGSAGSSSAMTVLTQTASLEDSCVLSASGDISADRNTIRRNGLLSAISYDLGTGNYGNYPLYIGRRGGTSLPFNGHLYSLIGIGRLTSDSETIALEKSIAKNTGVTLSV